MAETEASLLAEIAQLEREIAQVQTETSGLDEIRTESVYRLGGPTVFPLAQDSDGRLLGVRFDSQPHKITHYLILQQRELAGKGVERVDDDDEPCRYHWTVHQSTLPASIPVTQLAARYLLRHELADGESALVPGFNRVYKFAMRVYQEMLAYYAAESVELA